MPGQAAKVVITERQQVVLQEISRSRGEGQMIAQRAAIILLAFEGRLNEEIAQIVGLERKQVGLWRRRWQEAWEALTALECAEPRRLRESVRETLRDAPRSGSPGTFTAEQIAQIIAVTCEPPENSGRPITHWTHRELRDEVVKRGIVASISESHIGTLLRQSALQPHRRKLWLNTTEKDPVLFEQQVRRVCETYLEAAKLSEERGVHTVSTDELTGVQALERNAPSERMQPGQIARDEFEYTRHGTTTVIGNLDVVTGKMTTPTIGPTRTEEDFVEHVATTVAADPSGEWVFLVDTLNIHWSAGLVEFVHERCALNQPLGKKRQSGSIEKPSHAPRISVRTVTPHPLRVPAETQFVAQSDRNAVRHYQSQSRLPR